MKSHLRHSTIALAWLALSILDSQFSSVFAQGSLTPPGAPAPTMKTLSQIEPRTPISSLPYTISNPGSYYVTTNLTAAPGADGIDISANDVTLDLNGFTLLGVDGPNAGTGINVLNPARNLVIRNGVLDSWGGAGVGATNGNDSQFEQLRISNSNIRLLGILGALSAGSNCTVSRCTAVGNIGTGIIVGNNSTVKDCNASANLNYDGITAGNYCSVKDCTASGNHIYGITCGNYCAIVGTSANVNVQTGIAVGNNCDINDCTTGGDGGNGVGVGDYCSVKGCTANGNSTYGVGVGNYCIVKDCAASDERFDGIFVAGDNCQITGNTCTGNGSIGIYVLGSDNRVDNNTVGDNNSYGVYDSIANSANNITRNSAPGAGYGNTTGNNDYAPIGTPNTATSPWANFQ